jgi:hypothetical protein
MSVRASRVIAVGLTLATVLVASPVKEPGILETLSRYRDWTPVTEKPADADLSSVKDRIAGALS